MDEIKSFKDAINEWIKKNNKLQYYLSLKNIEYNKTAFKSLNLKDIIVSNNAFVDKFFQCLVNNEDYDKKIYPLLKQINTIEKYIIEEFDRMKKYDDLALIIFLHEDQKWTWFDIDSYLHFSSGSSRQKYNRYLKNKNDTL